MSRGTDCRKGRKELHFDIELHTERFAGSLESPRISLSQPLTGVERIHFVEILGA